MRKRGKAYRMLHGLLRTLRSRSRTGERADDALIGPVFEVPRTADAPAAPRPIATVPRLVGSAGGPEALRTFVMVAHGGPLEAKAAMLAASIRHVLGEGAVVHVAVAQPAERWGELAAPTLRLMDEVGARLVPVRNRVDPDYPHGNKIGALEAVHGPCAFLDSDMMLLQPFVTHWSLLACDAAAKVADLDTFGRGGGNWRAAYRTFDLPVSEHTVVASESGERMTPYYNAGFVYVRDGAAFARMWTETAIALDANPAVRNKRPWLDQISLPIACERLGWRVSDADERLNFPGHLKGDGGEAPYFLHYHDPGNIARFPRAMTLLGELFRSYPILRDVLAPHEDWADIVGTVA